MNNLEEALADLSAQQQDRLLSLWQQVVVGALLVAEFITIATNVVLAGNKAGYLLGVATARSLIEADTGVEEIVPAGQGTPHHLDVNRIEAALDTILDAEEIDSEMQLARLADNEPKEAAADGSHDVISQSEAVTGWVRSLDAEACTLCVWWWREGRIWQPDHKMPRHTGCTCEPVPITAVTDNYQTEKQAAERRRERSRT